MAFRSAFLRRTTQHPDAEESYFVSMTDIMVGLLFIFLILLLFFAYRIRDQHSDVVPRTEFEKVKKERDDALYELLILQANVRALSAHIDGLELELEDLRRVAGPLMRYFRASAEARAAVLRGLRERLTKAGLQVEIDETQGILRLQAGVLFGSGQFDLPDLQAPKSDGEQKTVSALRALATALEDVLRCRTFHDAVAACATDDVFVEAVLIEGHTDKDPIGAGKTAQIQTNHDLSALRATRTLGALIALAPRLGAYMSPANQPVLAASGYGPDRPVAQNDNETNKEKNRRIDVRLLMFTPRSLEALNEIEGQIRARIPR